MKNKIGENCEQFRNELWLYLDEILPKDKLETWKEHLTTCSKCSAELKTAKDTISLYENVPLEDIDNESYKMMINTATATSLSSTNNNVKKYTTKSRTFSEMFGFYKLAFGGGLLAAAILLIFITFINKPELPEIKTKISEELLAWDFPGFNTQSDNKQNQIVKLKTDGWDIYIVRKNSKEDWGSALRAIQKQISKMKKEVVSKSM